MSESQQFIDVENLYYFYDKYVHPRFETINTNINNIQTQIDNVKQKECNCDSFQLSTETNIPYNLKFYLDEEKTLQNIKVDMRDYDEIRFQTLSYNMSHFCFYSEQVTLDKYKDMTEITQSPQYINDSLKDDVVNTSSIKSFSPSTVLDSFLGGNKCYYWASANKNDLIEYFNLLRRVITNDTNYFCNKYYNTAGLLTFDRNQSLNACSFRMEQGSGTATSPTIYVKKKKPFIHISPIIGGCNNYFEFITNQKDESQYKKITKIEVNRVHSDQTATEQPITLTVTYSQEGSIYPLLLLFNYNKTNIYKNQKWTFDEKYQEQENGLLSDKAILMPRLINATTAIYPYAYCIENYSATNGQINEQIIQSSIFIWESNFYNIIQIPLYVEKGTSYYTSDKYILPTAIEDKIIWTPDSTSFIKQKTGITTYFDQGSVWRTNIITN